VVLFWVLWGVRNKERLRESFYESLWDYVQNLCLYAEMEGEINLLLIKRSWTDG